jgi:hypothetical protein
MSVRLLELKTLAMLTISALGASLPPLLLNATLLKPQRLSHPLFSRATNSLKSLSSLTEIQILVPLKSRINIHKGHDYRNL